MTMPAVLAAAGHAVGAGGPGDDDGIRAHRPGSPHVGGANRNDERGAEGGSEVHRPRVVADEKACAGQEVKQLIERRSSRKIDRAVSYVKCYRARERGFACRARENDRESVMAEQMPPEGCEPLGRPPLDLPECRTWSENDIPAGRWKAQSLPCPLGCISLRRGQAREGGIRSRGRISERCVIDQAEMQKALVNPFGPGRNGNGLVQERAAPLPGIPAPPAAAEERLERGPERPGEHDHPRAGPFPNGDKRRQQAPERLPGVDRVNGACSRNKLVERGETWPGDDLDRFAGDLGRTGQGRKRHDHVPDPVQTEQAASHAFDLDEGGSGPAASGWRGDEPGASRCASARC